MYKESIGLIGGFGAYATLSFYKRILEVFSTGKEIDYPHIYMDNNFTMPSRTRALLYGDHWKQVAEMIADSVSNLCTMNADHIIMVCGTAHAFLDDIYQLVPEAYGRIINIISETGLWLNDKQISEVLVLAAEGTVKNEIYSRFIKNIHCIYPSDKDFANLRFCIESVKTDSFSEKAADTFICLVEKYKCRDVILGCTEFPILVKNLSSVPSYRQRILSYNFIDPLEITLQRLKEILK